MDVWATTSRAGGTGGTQSGSPPVHPPRRWTDELPLPLAGGVISVRNTASRVRPANRSGSPSTFCAFGMGGWATTSASVGGQIASVVGHPPFRPRDRWMGYHFRERRGTNRPCGRPSTFPASRQVEGLPLFGAPAGSGCSVVCAATRSVVGLPVRRGGGGSLPGDAGAGEACRWHSRPGLSRPRRSGVSGPARWCTGRRGGRAGDRRLSAPEARAGPTVVAHECIRAADERVGYHCPGGPGASRAAPPRAACASVTGRRPRAGAPSASRRRSRR